HGLLISTMTLEDAFVRLTGSNDSRDDVDDWEAAA
ncbi:ABC transporter ATP-binding protein, partial [Salmonella enterica subsp. enterica serovar Enteritidis]|nr:ABC transporter ATP-binding protein [Salmonella enterica subsp. enterica serovar Enteritidis]